MRCSIMQLATKNRHIEVIAFLINELDYDINMVCLAATPLDHARSFMRENDPTIAFLLESGGVPYNELIENRPDLVQRSDDRCSVVQEALSYDSVEVMEFLFFEMEFFINMVCHDMSTPLDMLFDSYEGDIPKEEDDAVYSFLVENDAKRTTDLPDDDLEIAHVFDDRCEVIASAIEFESTEVLHFLIDSLNFDVNMVCDTSTSSPLTPLEIAYDILGDNDQANEIISFLVTKGARSLQPINEHYLQSQDSQSIQVENDNPLFDEL